MTDTPNKFTTSIDGHETFTGGDLAQNERPSLAAIYAKLQRITNPPNQTPTERAALEEMQRWRLHLLDLDNHLRAGEIQSLNTLVLPPRPIFNSLPF